MARDRGKGQGTEDREQSARGIRAGGRGKGQVARVKGQGAGLEY